MDKVNKKINKQSIFIPGYWNKEKIIIAMQQILKKEKNISINDFRWIHIKYHMCNRDTALRYFKSWKNFENEVGFKFNKKRNFSKKELIKIVYDIIKKEDNVYRTNLSKILKKYNKCNYDTIKRKFNGSINFHKEFYEATGTKIEFYKIWDKEKIIKIMKRIIKENINITKNDLDNYRKKYGLCCKNIIIKHFKTWKNFENIIGFKFFIPKNTKKYKKNDIINEVKKAYDEYGPLMKTDIKKIVSCSAPTLRNKFGSIDKLAEEANIKLKPGRKIIGNKGKYETLILDIIQESENTKIDRSIWINTNNKQYVLDGYDPIKNIAYEIDEPYHSLPSQRIKDQIRQDAILETLGCSFIRINEQHFLNKLRNKNQTNLENFTGELK